MKWIKMLISMIQFFTRIPIKFNIPIDKEDFGKALIFAPVAGLIIGFFLLGVYKLLHMMFPLNVVSILLIISYILISGGLHLDGLGDTFDGIFSNRSKERILEIMRDSRVGTNAVLAVFAILMLNYALIQSFSPSSLGKVLLLFPVAGRIGALTAAGLFSYARTGEGLGKTFVDYCGIRQVIVGFMFTMLIFYFVIGYRGVIIATIPLITSMMVTKFLSRKIGGVTGDVLGAVCEINQTLFLIIMLAVSSVYRII